MVMCQQGRYVDRRMNEVDNLLDDKINIYNMLQNYCEALVCYHKKRLKFPKNSVSEISGQYQWGVCFYQKIQDIWP